jgi:hypothetical protein
MDMEYLKDHICEELADSQEYATHAIELKPMTASWAKSFIDMATAELNHAAYLYKMFVEYYQKIASTYSEIPDYVEDMYKETCRCYSSESAKAKYMIDMYSK